MDIYEFANSPLISRFGQNIIRVETIKGPTEYNATNLPTGLEIDSTNGQIFGTPTATGEFNSTIISNISGSDSEILKFVVLKESKVFLSNKIWVLLPMVQNRSILILPRVQVFLFHLN